MITTGMVYGVPSRWRSMASLDQNHYNGHTVDFAKSGWDKVEHSSFSDVILYVWEDSLCLSHCERIIAMLWKKWWNILWNSVSCCTTIKCSFWLNSKEKLPHQKFTCYFDQWASCYVVILNLHLSLCRSLMSVCLSVCLTPEFFDMLF